MIQLWFCCFQDVEDKPKKSKSRDKGVTGYKGAKTIEEEWELLVHEVYETVKDDPSIVPDTMAKLKNEVAKYPKTKVGGGTGNLYVFSPLI